MQAGIYKHYKGGFYQVIGVAEHTETAERLVVYVALTGAHLPSPRIRCRPLSGPEGWNTDVLVPIEASRIEMPTSRFVYVGDEIPAGERPEGVE